MNIRFIQPLGCVNVYPDVHKHLSSYPAETYGDEHLFSTQSVQQENPPHPSARLRWMRTGRAKLGYFAGIDKEALICLVRLRGIA